MTTLTYENGALVLRSRYDANLVAAVKALPTSDRAYRKDDRAWMIAPAHGALVAQLVSLYLNETVTVPQVTATTQAQTVWLEIRYIGQTKDRGADERTAFGWANGGWNVILPEGALKAWFCAEPTRPDELPTLYAVLGVGRDTAGTDLKAAWRRFARQWHPDVCKEPDAKAQFQRIQEAYEVLSDPGKRARYDAGLALEASLGNAARRVDPNETQYGYRAPLLCGRLRVEAVEKLGRWAVSKILNWDDITRADGRTLVVSWPKGAEAFTEAWL